MGCFAFAGTFHQFDPFVETMMLTQRFGPSPTDVRKAQQKGWTREIHTREVLLENQKFKGRIDEGTCTFFHNGLFPNWWLTIQEPNHKKAFAEVQFVMNFNGTTVPFLTAESLLMLFKEKRAKEMTGEK